MGIQIEAIRRKRIIAGSRSRSNGMGESSQPAQSDCGRDYSWAIFASNYYPSRVFTESSQKISTHLLTVLIMRAIVHVEQRKGIQREQRKRFSRVSKGSGF